VSEETNSNLPARKTPVQLLVLYTDPERHNAQRCRLTGGQTDGRHDDANSRSHRLQCTVGAIGYTTSNLQVRVIHMPISYIPYIKKKF